MDAGQRYHDQLLGDLWICVGNACIVHIVVLELAVLVCFYRPLRSVIVAQFHDLAANSASPIRHYRRSLSHLRTLPKKGRAARRPPPKIVLWSLALWRRAALFDDFHDATAARLHDHRPIVHDRIAIARSDMIPAGYRVKRHASRRQHRADAHIAFVPV